MREARGRTLDDDAQSGSDVVASGEVSMERNLQGLSSDATPEAKFGAVLALSALVSKPEVTRLPGDACVSAIFRVTFLKVLFSSDHAGILRFWIGGVVRKISRKSEITAQRIFPT